MTEKSEAATPQASGEVVEVRLSPGGREVAIRNNADSAGAPWRVTNGGHYRDEQVSDWIPLVPDDGQREHVIDVREDGWTIKHPMSCRSDLFACVVNRAAEEQLIEQPGPVGRYVCAVDDDGVFLVYVDRGEVTS